MSYHPQTLSLLLVLVSAGSCSSSNAEADASEIGEWPKESQLTHSRGNLEEAGLRFADGALIDTESNPEEADIIVGQGQVIALIGSGAETVCPKGVFDRLALIPVGQDDCGAPGQTLGWGTGISLSGASEHTEEESYSAGQSALFWDRERTTLYRLRVLGDSYTNSITSTARFEYEPAQP